LILSNKNEKRITTEARRTQRKQALHFLWGFNVPSIEGFFIAMNHT